MNTFLIKRFLFIAVFGTISSIAIAQNSESRHTGTKAILNLELWEKVTKDPIPQTAAQKQIAQVLSIASKMDLVSDVMSVKEAGLVYVTNLADLDYLTTFTVENPSEAYIAATAEFIAKYVGAYIFDRYDIPSLIKLNGRVKTINQAMACKNAGLKVAGSAASFLRILPYGFQNPTDEYKSQISAFIVANIQNQLGPRSSIETIIQIEKYSVLTIDAMAIKNAGLIAVKSKTDLLALAQFAFKNPSPSYKQAISEFIKTNLSRYP